MATTSLLEQIKHSSPRARIVVAGSALVLIAIFGLAGLVASKPHFVTLYSGLDDQQRVAVERALAEGGVKYNVSLPPAPYAVYVDEGRIYRAQTAVALAGALQRDAIGISPSQDGKTAIFQSSGERSQGMLKREWQELELMLQTLDFVKGAKVTSSRPESSPLRRDKPLTVAVTLNLNGVNGLTGQQSGTVAKLVQYCFNAQPENIVISDQNGRPLFGVDDPEDDVDSFLDKIRQHDLELQEAVNETLALAFGEDRAFVTVKSEWSRDKRVVLSEQVDPKARAANREEEIKTETPQASSSAGGPVGTAANLSQGSGGAAAGGATLATTKETSKTFDTSKQTSQTVEDTPRLNRLSVAVLVDESLSTQMQQIESFVKNAVGFDDLREDNFSIGTTTFAVDEEASEEEQVPEAPGGPSPMMKLLLERGVELLVAATFIFLLLKSLKGGKPPEPAAGDTQAAAAPGSPGTAAEPGAVTTAEGEAPEEAELDPELVARMKIEDLVKNDPRRVGEILSAWARDEKAGAGAG